MKELKRIFGVVVLLVLWNPVIVAQNPLIKDIGMSDPHVRVFNDTIFLYTGHDSHPDDEIWVMNEWRIFFSTNLLDWKLAGTISPRDNFMDDNSTDCWAADAASRNGNYYFYFSDRKRGVGVMQAKSPQGPFLDALGKPLVSPMHDPTILIDDDENRTPYLIYGDKEGGGFHIAKLNEDMISLAEQPIAIEINGMEWESAPVWMDKNYIFKRNGTYYLTWGRDYAISTNIYGPYTCVGAVGKGHNLNEFAHGSFFEWKGQFYHVWCYYIRPEFKYRETIISYCHFDDDGKIVTDTKFLDQHFENGVGQYDASWEKIEAEWFYEKSRGIVKQSNKTEGFEIANLENESWLHFANVNFDGASKQFFANLFGNEKNKKAKIEIHLDSLDGPIIGAVSFPKSSEYELVDCKTRMISGKRDVYFKFTGISNEKLKLDWFRFSE